MALTVIRCKSALITIITGHICNGGFVFKRDTQSKFGNKRTILTQVNTINAHIYLQLTNIIFFLSFNFDTTLDLTVIQDLNLD